MLSVSFMQIVSMHYGGSFRRIGRLNLTPKHPMALDVCNIPHAHEGRHMHDARHPIGSQSHLTGAAMVNIILIIVL